MAETKEVSVVKADAVIYPVTQKVLLARGVKHKGNLTFNSFIERNYIMRKLIVSLLSMAMIVVFLLSCGGRGGGGEESNPPPPQPKYDATGIWNVEANPASRTCHDDRFCAACDNIKQIIENEYANIDSISVTQNGNSFTVITGNETFDGVISYDVYSYSGQETETQQGVTVTMDWNMKITMDHKDHFNAFLIYDISARGYGLICTVQLSFKGWREGAFDPIASVYPMVYDYGVTQFGEKKIQEFTISNQGQLYHGTGNQLIITWITTGDPDHIFYYDWNFSDGSETNVPAGESRTFTVAYEPNTWPSQDSYTLVLQTNDPNNPEIRIELSGEASDSFPQVSVISTTGDLCDCPEKTPAGETLPADVLACICFDDMDTCSGESVHKRFEITNVGTWPLTFNFEYGSGCDFSTYNAEQPLYDPIVGVNLGSGDVKEFTATFHPVTGGEHWYESVFTSDDPNHERFRVMYFGNSNQVSPVPDCTDIWCR